MAHTAVCVNLISIWASCFCRLCVFAKSGRHNTTASLSLHPKKSQAVQHFALFLFCLSPPTMSTNGGVKFFAFRIGLLLLLFGIISYHVAVMFGVVATPHYWKQLLLFTRTKQYDLDNNNNLSSLCNVDDTKDCTDKEKKYIVKMKDKSKLEIQTQFTRLNGMKDNAMSAELKQWLHQRLNILRGLGAVEIKPWRVCTAEDTTDCSHKEKVYIDKMKGKKLAEIEKEHARLDSMKGDAMSADLKNWLHQRLRILDGLMRAQLSPVKNEMKLSWRVIKQWFYQRLGWRVLQPRVDNNDQVLPWRVQEREYPKEELEKKEDEEPTMEVKEAGKTQEEFSKEEEEKTTTAASDGEEEILEL